MSSLTSTRRRVALLGVLLLPLALSNGHAAILPTAPAAKSADARYSSPALFNEANAFARQGKVGLAILDYERAQLLSPDDPDIAANLHTVRAKAGLPDAPPPSALRWLTSIPPNTLAWLGCFGLVLVGFSVLLGRSSPRHRMSFRFATFVGGLLMVASVSGAALLWPQLHAAIVVTSDASARISPANAAESLFKLKEGEAVSVQSHHADFLLVQTPAGRSGWVASADVASLIPSTAPSG